MTVLTHDQKNANIQAWFDGKQAGMVVMDDKGFDDASQSCIDYFRGHFHGIIKA